MRSPEPDVSSPDYYMFPHHYTAVEEIASPSQMFSLYLLQPHYRKLGTSEWLHQPLFEPLLENIAQEFEAVQGSTESCHQVKKTKNKYTYTKYTSTAITASMWSRTSNNIPHCGTELCSMMQHADRSQQEMPGVQHWIIVRTSACHGSFRNDWIFFQKLVGQMHQDVAVEYVKRLLKGGIKLKDQNLQLKAYNNMKEDAENLHRVFTKMVRVDRGGRQPETDSTEQGFWLAECFPPAGLSGRLVEGRLGQHCRSAQTPGPVQHSATRGAHGKVLLGLEVNFARCPPGQALTFEKKRFLACVTTVKAVFKKNWGRSFKLHILPVDNAVRTATGYKTRYSCVWIARRYCQHTAPLRYPQNSIWILHSDTDPEL